MLTSRLKCRRKSAPRIGLGTSATTNTHRKVRRNPKFRVRERVPYVLIDVIDSLKCERSWLSAVFSWRGWNDTDFRPSVHQKSCASDRISNVEKATGW